MARLPSKAKRRKPSTDAVQRRIKRLYPLVGQAIHYAQALELYLNVTVTLVNRARAASIDKTLFELPDSKETLRPLIKALQAVLPDTTKHVESALADALNARNHVAHHFFMQNIEALATDAGYEAAKLDLLMRMANLAIAVTQMQTVATTLVKTLGLQDTEMRMRQAELATLPALQAAHKARRREQRARRSGASRDAQGETP